MIVAILAMGEMGAGVAACLTSAGMIVRTSLGGRSGASAERARAAGAIVCDDADLLDGADLVLSIVPPAVALALAQRLHPHLSALTTKPAYVDCNAISMPVAREIGAVVTSAGATFIDAGIIGGPPRTDGSGPRFYVSGDNVGPAFALTAAGLDIVDLHAPAGAASSLKLGYAALTKGVVALGTAIEIGAARNGVADALRAEMQRTQPQLRAFLDRRLPEVPAKAYRWVAEMDGVAHFLDGPENGSAVYAAIGRFYEHLAAVAERGDRPV